MKNLHICLFLTLFFVINSTYSQYLGGDGDGFEVYSLKPTFVDGTTLEATFFGGDGDGFAMDRDSAIYLGGSSVNGPFEGGNGDGFSAFISQPLFVDGNSTTDLYGGGIGDGGDNEKAIEQFLEGSKLDVTYLGGNGDGATADFQDLQFLDGSVSCAIYNLVAIEPDTIIDSMYTQDIVVYYILNPGLGDLVVNNQIFPITGSPQTITLTGLFADGLPVDVSAYFSDTPDCMITEEALYIAPGGTNSIYPQLGAPQIRFSSYPNPFTNNITFSIELDQPGSISLDLMSLNGKMVAHIYEGNINSGFVNEVQYNGAQLPQGIYLTRLQVNGYTYYLKMVKLK